MASFKKSSFSSKGSTLTRSARETFRRVTRNSEEIQDAFIKQLKGCAESSRTHRFERKKIIGSNAAQLEERQSHESPAIFRNYW